MNPGGGAPRRLVLAAAAVCAGGALTLALVEGGLSLAGVRREWRYCRGWAEDDMRARYIPRPGTHTEFGGTFRINSRGFRGPEVGRAAALFLGDSCTFGVGVADGQAFPALLSRPGWETANAGVPGHNSTAGLARLRGLRLDELRPRFVVIYYGWNDHWRAAATERAFARLRALAPRWRFAALLLEFQQSLWARDTPYARLRLTPQVPLRDFSSNLREMIALSRASGAVPVLVTPAFDPGRVSPGWNHAEDTARYHDAYVDAVRETSRRTGTPLLDFARAAQGLPPGERSRLFIDPIHLSAEGHRRLAGELRALLASLEPARGA